MEKRGNETGNGMEIEGMLKIRERRFRVGTRIGESNISQ